MDACCADWLTEAHYTCLTAAEPPLGISRVYVHTNAWKYSTTTIRETHTKLKLLLRLSNDLRSLTYGTMRARELYTMYPFTAVYDTAMNLYWVHHLPKLAHSSFVVEHLVLLVELEEGTGSTAVWHLLLVTWGQSNIIPVVQQHSLHH